MAGRDDDSAPTHTGASLSYPASSSLFSSSVSPMSATSAPASNNSLSSALLASASYAPTTGLSRDKPARYVNGRFFLAAPREGSLRYPLGRY